MIPNLYGSAKKARLFTASGPDRILILIKNIYNHLCPTISEKASVFHAEQVRFAVTLGMVAPRV